MSTDWWSQIAHPSFTESDRFSMRNTICWILDNWPSIYSDLQRELAMTQQSNANPTGAKLINDLNELVSVFSRVLPEKPKFNIGNNDDWIQASTYESIFEQWRASYGSMGQLSAELRQVLDSVPFEETPAFADMSRAVDDLISSFSDKRIDNRFRENLKKLREVGRRVLENENEIKSAVRLMVEKMPWRDAQAVPEFIDGMIKFVGSMMEKNFDRNSKTAKTIRPYLAGLKAILDYLNEYARLMPCKPNL